MDTTAIRDLREVVRSHVNRTSLRAVARQVGMSPSGIHKFLQGSQPYSPTLRRLRSWYEGLSGSKSEEFRQPAFSPAEAAFITGVSARLINRIIDDQEIMTLRAGTETRARLIGIPELVYLTLRRHTEGVLTARARATLYGQIKRSVRGESAAVPFAEVGYIRVPVASVVDEVSGQIRQLEAARRFVSVDPGVRAGEPVVRGTRVSVYRLAELAQKGVSREVILEDHPSVSAAALEGALLYARTYPRRGRPPLGPWHTAAPSIDSADGQRTLRLVS
ncbi:MAG TPA: DUF433 domain-containing protein [Longimicrobium sp.]|nr:DUF433 domain-containing protein [Longimicrobium sp.]